MCNLPPRNRYKVHLPRLIFFAASVLMPALTWHGSVRADDPIASVPPAFDLAVDAAGGKCFFKNNRLVVYFPKKSITDQQLQHILDRATDLTIPIHLNLRGTPITDAGLEKVGVLNHLEVLDVSHTRVTNQTIAHLDGHAKLKELWMEGVRIDDSGIDHVVQLPAIAVLRLGGPKITDDGVGSIAKIETLEELTLMHPTNVSDRGISYLAGMQRLKSLTVIGGLNYLDFPREGVPNRTEFYKENGIAVTDVGLEAISRIANLESLTISGTQITDRGLQYLVAAKKLNRLHFGYSAITDEGMQSLGKVSELRDLSLANVDITDAGMKHLDSLWKLEELSLNDTQVTREGSIGFQSIPKQRPLPYFPITHVRRSGGPMRHALTARHQAWKDQQLTDDDVLVSLSKERFSVRRRRDGYEIAALTANVTEDDLRLIGNLKKLNVLKFAKTSITDNDLAHLKTIESLTSLDLSETRVTGVGLKHLISKEEQELRSLSLRGCPLSVPQAMQLKSFNSLRMLDLRDTNLPADFASELAELPHLSWVVFDDAHLVSKYQQQDTPIGIWPMGSFGAGRDIFLPNLNALQRALPRVYAIKHEADQQLTRPKLQFSVPLDDSSLYTKVVKCSRDGKFVAIGREQIKNTGAGVRRWRISLLDIRSRSLIVLEESSTKRFDLSPDSIVFAPDGKTVLAFSPSIGIVQWDLRATPPKRKVLIENTSDPNAALAFSHDGQRLYAVTSDAQGPGGKLAAFDSETGDEIQLRRNPVTMLSPSAIAVRPDGEKLTLGSYFGDVSEVDVQAWRRESSFDAEDLARTPHLEPKIKHLSYTGDGRFLHLFHDGCFMTLDATTNKLTALMRLSPPVFGLDGSGHRLAASLIYSKRPRDYVVRIGLWEFNRGYPELSAQLEIDPTQQFYSALALSSDGNTLVTAGESITFWNISEAWNR